MAAAGEKVVELLLYNGCKRNTYFFYLIIRFKLPQDVFTYKCHMAIGTGKKRINEGYY